MKRVLNIALSIIGVLAVAVIAGIIFMSKPLPEGVEGEAAEALADKMLAAVNLPAWESIRYLKWTFRGGHSYVWDRWYNLAEICYDDTRVLLNLNTLEGRAWVGGDQLYAGDKRDRLQQAWQYWCNDSFWLNPFVKVRDEGVVRKKVDLDSGNDGLLVTFTSGGVTPGDSHLFELDEDGLPTRWNMWVSVLPMKGIGFDIIDWKEVNGARVAVRHRTGPVDITIDDVESGDHHSEIGLSRDPFTDF